MQPHFHVKYCTIMKEEPYWKIPIKTKKYEDRAIVFLDFLGFRNIVEKTVNSDAEFQELLETLNNIVNYVTTTSEDEARLVLHPQEIEKSRKICRDAKRL